ncbi:CPCC family cysteine-rich protein [Amycolatopsis sp. NPDC059657]|uniref:CPCC family cysteine-rich protein n=1 Tax=Amycolatopsis sp. NPDC059657 TaxID=3346899 RepID=UPI00366EA16E
MTDRFPCPCCGHLMFDEPPGSYYICSVCFWEDDSVQLRWPDWAGGANKPSLIEAQDNYLRLGACEAQSLPRVHSARPDQPIEAEWRPINLTIDNFEAKAEQNAPWPDNLTVLYWWRPTFWRARHHNT